jgi:hypothetical protein
MAVRAAAHAAVVRRRRLPGKIITETDEVKVLYENDVGYISMWDMHGATLLS